MTVSPPPKKTNRIGLEFADYKGKPSTLCKGCGHDSISAQIIAVCFELGIDATNVVKLSGIGCSSKTPAYFLNQSHGFNTIHGRMPSVATGVMLANRTLTSMGVSGDGDTGSIGLGQFKHMMRRNVPMVYIIENNGVYGLTKGQFSATADEGQTLRHAGLNELPPLDLCKEALIADCSFVARSFSGDPKQVQALLKAALSHRGTAVIDIISPCVTFNNHEESTKSYDYGRSHEDPLQDITFIPAREEITVEYEEGTSTSVTMHDGSTIILKKLGNDYEPNDRFKALELLDTATRNQQFVTGLLFVDETRESLAELLSLPEKPLAELTETDLRPSREVLAKLMADLA